MKKILLIVLAIIVIAVLGLLFFLKSDVKNPYPETEWGRFSGISDPSDVPDNDYGTDIKGCDYSVSENDIPVFQEVNLGWENIFDNKKSLPIMGSAMIDVDNDGVDEIFISGGITQEDALMVYKDGGFVKSSFALPAKPSNTTTFGAVSFDLDADGNNDLILTGNYGILWYKNNGSGFDVQKISAPLNLSLIHISEPTRPY